VKGAVRRSRVEKGRGDGERVDADHLVQLLEGALISSPFFDFNAQGSALRVPISPTGHFPISPISWEI
jgi:hypothetical protein